MALLVAPGLAFARAEYDADRLLITFGAFCQQDAVDEVPAPDTYSATVELLPEVPHILWPTHRIPALPGLSFGIRSEGLDDEVFYPVLIELVHPPFIGTDVTRQSYVTELGGEGPSINAYSFDIPEELVTGIWTFRAILDGEVLYFVEFEVVDPALAPSIGAGCGMQFMS